MYRSVGTLATTDSEGYRWGELVLDALDRFRLTDRVAVVTGASSGLGAEFAVALAGVGADVVLAARRVDKLEETRRAVEALGRRAVVVTADVRVESDCQRVIATAVDELGHVDVLLNNAGVSYATPAHKDASTQFVDTVATNLVGAYQMALAAGSRMIADGRPGSIVNVASVLGMSGSHLPAAGYSASKAGVIGMSRDLAMQWTGRYGIRVNTLAPGFFETDMTAPIRDSDKMLAGVEARTPMGRLGAAPELVGAMLLLASDAGSYITGITLAVDGGWTLH